MRILFLIWLWLPFLQEAIPFISIKRICSLCLCLLLTFHQTWIPGENHTGCVLSPPPPPQKEKLPIIFGVFKKWGFIDSMKESVCSLPLRASSLFVCPYLSQKHLATPYSCQGRIWDLQCVFHRYGLQMAPELSIRIVKKSLLLIILWFDWKACKIWQWLQLTWRQPSRSTFFREPVSSFLVLQPKNFIERNGKRPYIGNL